VNRAASGNPRVRQATLVGVAMESGPTLPSGVFAAVPSFFREDESLDLEAFREHLLRMAQAGLQGVLVCGSTGEFPLLDARERMALAEAAVDCVGSRMAVVVHVGTPSTRQTEALARHAVAVGADAVAAITPYYLPVDAAALGLHLRRTKQAAGDLPLLAYSFAARAGTQYPAELLAQLAAEGVVAGVKESGPELSRLLDLRRRCGLGFRIYAGAAELLAAATAHGMDGGVLALANAVPDALLRVHRLAAEGEVARAAALFDSLRGVQEATQMGLMPAGLKAVLAALHGAPAQPRAPRQLLDATAMARVTALLREVDAAVLRAQFTQK
jgi:4-hydroxy-tetrahydrodipicolinate synthase